VVVLRERLERPRRAVESELPQSTFEIPSATSFLLGLVHRDGFVHSGVGHAVFCSRFSVCRLTYSDHVAGRLTGSKK
jgi:hypothetical protein